MNVLLVGASGALGQEVVKRVSYFGHQLSVLVREPGAYKAAGSESQVLKGDASRAEDVAKAVQGQEAIICSLGISPTLKHVTLFSEGTKNLLQAMAAQATPPRLIVVTGIGAGESRGHGGFVYDNLIEPTVLRTIYEDKDRQEQILRESSAHWIGVRPGILTNDPAKGEYRVLTDLTDITVGKIARADVADFLVQQLTSDTYLHQFPTICY